MSTRPVATLLLRSLAALTVAVVACGVAPAVASRSVDGTAAAQRPSGHRAGYETTSVTSHSARPRKNCADNPHACGYPDATNTGVKRPKALRPSGSVTASRDGQVIKNLDISGEINVTAPNVVIKNVRVTNDDGDWVIIIRPGADHLVIKDSEVMSPAGATVDNACVFNISNSRPRLVRLNIHGCSAGVSTGGGVLKDSYIHDPGYTAGLSHVTLVASNGGGHFRIKHNTVLNPLDQTAAIAFYQDFGTQSDNLVEDNLLGGGGYVVYGGNGDYAETHDVRFIGNRFTRMFHQRGGYWGVVASFDRNNPGNEWSGNFWDETLARVRG